MALALLDGLPALKMPLPTNTPSMPICIISAASAGVATPPAAKFTTGRRPKCFVCEHKTRNSGYHFTPYIYTLLPLTTSPPVSPNSIFEISFTAACQKPLEQWPLAQSCTCNLITQH